MKKLAIVTGGAGFVGSHLCEVLVKREYRTISLDNYFTGSKDNHVGGVEYIDGHTKNISKLIKVKPDIIYHLGEYSRVHESYREPNLVWDMCLIGTAAVLEFWRANRCKLVYTASSTKVADTHRSDKLPGKDLTPYTWAKASNSDLVKNYGRWFDLPYATTYFYNVYGPRERAWGDYGTVVGTFRYNFLHNLPHKVNSPGTQTRAFTHVLDTVDALIRVGEKGYGDGYTISSDDVNSILDVANYFGGEIQMMPQTSMSRSSTADDSSKVRELGWKQRHTLREYILQIRASQKK